ncbi:MAG TPA: ABC transporter ATP-binding protein [Cellvibrio sp.]|nr:ABC transporter ATP-binding protein [Cellvibrio sp.]
MLDIKNLQRKIDNVTIIKSVTAQVKAGDVIALLGKNGAGKTTLLETLLGFSFPSFGGVQIWGENATEMKGDIKQRIGFVPQQDELLAGFNGREHIDLFKAFRKTWNSELVDRLVAEWLIPMDIAARKMSVGQRQKLSILLAIAHEPELLILDEPVASLDPVARRQFLQQLVDIAADENRAIIFSSHIVSDMERVANQVWMLQNGELSYQGGLDELKESIARLTISAKENLPTNLGLSNVVKQRIQGEKAWVTLKNWSPEQQEKIAQQLNADVQVDYLSLEDIFLELNS